jgi:hypothetical protein
MTKISYDNRRFRSVQNSGTGEVGGDTVFQYRQAGDVVWAEYSGGDILRGHLIARCDNFGELDVRYHHMNIRGVLMTGVCTSSPEILADDRIRLHERWQWTSGDLSSGESVIEEVRDEPMEKI